MICFRQKGALLGRRDVHESHQNESLGTLWLGPWLRADESTEREPPRSVDHA